MVQAMLTDILKRVALEEDGVERIAIIPELDRRRFEAPFIPSGFPQITRYENHGYAAKRGEVDIVMGDPNYVIPDRNNPDTQGRNTVNINRHREPPMVDAIQKQQVPFIGFFGAAHLAAIQGHPTAAVFAHGNNLTASQAPDPYGGRVSIFYVNSSNA